MSAKHRCCVYLGDELARYAFGDDHPFGPLRHDAFRNALYSQALDQHADILNPVMTTPDILELFHEKDYIRKVRHMSKLGTGFLDQGDTPAFVGMFEAAVFQQDMLAEEKMTQIAVERDPAHGNVAGEP